MAVDVILVDPPGTSEVGWIELRKAPPSFGLVIATVEGKVRPSDDLLVEAHNRQSGNVSALVIDHPTQLGNRYSLNRLVTLEHRTSILSA